MRPGSGRSASASPIGGAGGVAEACALPLDRGCGAGREKPLVSSPISQQRAFDSIEVYPRSLRVRRPFTGQVATPPPDRSDSGIQSFSDKSRSRLRFMAANSSHLLQSQFCCTYHDYWPINGREFKRHLNVFLTAARRAFPSLRYLWVAEFQTRGAPHAHVYLNLPATYENRFMLAVLWCRVVNLNDSQLMAFHNHPSNMIAWTMGTGSYLCKYLDKQHQKAIPEGFHSFGRWWGNSRGLVPPPDAITPEDLRACFPEVNQVTGECLEVDPLTFLVRTVGRYHEKCNRRSWFRRTNRTTTALTGAPIFRQTLAYLLKLHGDPAADPPRPRLP